jgi:hypothetical protein
MPALALPVLDGEAIEFKNFRHLALAKPLFKLGHPANFKFKF